jgi:hypothetical protein
VVKQLRNETSATIGLELSLDGFYQIQIIDHATGEIKTEKVVIKKR